MSLCETGGAAHAHARGGFLEGRAGSAMPWVLRLPQRAAAAVSAGCSCDLLQ